MFDVIWVPEGLGCTVVLQDSSKSNLELDFTVLIEIIVLDVFCKYPRVSVSD